MNLEWERRSNRPAHALGWLWSEYSVVFAFLAIVLLAVIVNGGDFASPTNFVNILRQVSIIGIISLGMSVVMLSGGIDLSVGAVLAFVGAITIIVLNNTGSVLIALVTAIGSGAVIGGLNGFMITKGRIASFIATLGVMAAARSLALYIADGGSIAGKVEGYTAIANHELLGLSYPIWIFLAVTAFIYVLMHKTKFGRYVYAIGSNEKAAILSAIRVDRVKIGVYMLCSILVGLAAVIESSRLNSISSASSGLSYELDAIAAVIIGGTRMTGGRGKVIGTFFGILILGVLNNTMNLVGVSPYLQGLVKGLIIITAVLLQRKD
ncbi:ribose ABC transporter permease [Paenibacillus swuensis]|uniref:Ribose ABC transporter permease n=1 Tax=Paenibacillus swuensis TaxID=1178515 RepID=A0A172TIS4_9BACL|nr:ABC transporter permease [Paenibacillus swuensis]ANE46872.1 ribose ABC transporter permease [Paenibacillus swuensis]